MLTRLIRIRPETVNIIVITTIWAIILLAASAMLGGCESATALYHACKEGLCR